MNTPDREAVCPVPVCVLRLLLAAFVAVMVLISLLHGLSMARRQAKAVSPITFSSKVATSGFTRCQRSTLHVDKTVDPLEPEVGSVITISFIITGLSTKALDVALVQDVSGSMLTKDVTGTSESRLTASKVAATMFVTRMQPTDWVAIIAYSDTAHLAQPLTRTRYAITNTIDDLRAEKDWYTNIEDGIYKGYQELISPTHQHRYLSQTVKVIVLLSDGIANRSNHPDDPWKDPYTATIRALNQADEARKCGILIYTIGFGKDANPTLLRDIADITDGKYYAAADSATLKAIYREIAMELRNIVITDVLQSGVDLDCNLMPDGWGCFESADGFTTVTYTIDDQQPRTDPLVLSFTATTSLPSDYDRQVVNASGSCAHYDGPGNPFDRPGNPPCQNFVTPTVCMQPYLTDTYEPDDDWCLGVQPISPGELLLRNFSHSGDADWVKSRAWSGEVHTFTTYAISSHVGDRLLELYTGTCRVDLTCIATGANSLARTSVQPYDGSYYYYLRVSSLDNHFGCGTQYTLSFEHSPLTEFTLALTPFVNAVFQGQAVSYLIELKSFTPGFSVPVALDVGGVPTGTLCDIAPSEITSGVQATLLITTSKATPLGSHRLVITGTDGDFKRSAWATLEVRFGVFLPIVLKH